MDTFDLVLKFLSLAIVLLCGTAIWYAIASWLKYRFSAWWLMALLLLPLALLMFPLYSHLRYQSALKQGRPQPEVERNRLYLRMSWALIGCYMVTSILTRAILHAVLPGNDYAGELQFVVTTLSLTVASVGVLWAIRNRNISAK